MSSLPVLTGLRHAQTPPSPMRRLLSNIEIVELERDRACAVLPSPRAGGEKVARSAG